MSAEGAGTVHWALVHDGPLREWQAECVRHMQDAGAVLALVVRLPEPTAAGQGWTVAERVLRRRCTAIRPASTDLAGIEHRDAGDHEEAGRVLAEHGATAPIDLVVDLTRRDRAVTAEAPLGVWSLSGDRGDAIVGLGDIAAGNTTTLVTLRRTRNGTDDVLRWGRFSVSGHAVAASIDHVLSQAAEWPALAVQDGRLGVRLSPPPASPATAARRPATPARLMSRALRSNLARVRRIALADIWNVGIVSTPLDRIAAGAPLDVEWLPARRHGTYTADPFAVQIGPEQWIFVEDYDYRTDRGTLRRIVRQPGTTNGHGSGREDELEAGDTHLSYPYLLWEDDRLLCIPETGEAREVALYEVDQSTGALRRVATLLDGVAALDATVLRHGDRWWMFLTDGDRGNASLSAWHAAELLGPWTPHAGNPVKLDVASARGAGTPFVHDGALYRPAQDGSRTYGGAVVLNRVVSLSPTEFVEEAATVLSPQPDWPYPDGLHTLSSIGTLTVIDAKRFAPLPRAVLWKVRSRLSRARGGSPTGTDQGSA